MSSDTDANKERSRQLYEQVFGLGNFGAAEALLAPDVLNHGPGVPDSTGTEGIKGQGALLRAAFPDLEVILNDQVAEGDKVVSYWTGRGTHAGPLNLPAPAAAQRRPDLVRRDADRPAFRRADRRIMVPA